MTTKPITEAYRAGHAANRAGQPNCDNTHVIIRGGGNQNRIDWFDGWYDARHESMWPHLFEPQC